MIKALFFDIDGTLVSFKTHRIPVSTVEALLAAKARGTKIFISTGRAFPLINNIDTIVPLVDGYITTNGAHSFTHDGFEQFTPINSHDATVVTEYLLKTGTACMVVGRNDIIFPNLNRQLERQFEEMFDLHFQWSDKPLDELTRQGILQFTPIIDDAEEARLMAGLEHCTSSRWCPYFADITACGVNKGNGMLAICKHIGIDSSETMAFGDGGNDLPIIKQAGIGVAMGNANEAIKPHADYVTTSVDDDGIARALAHFGVI